MTEYVDFPNFITKGIEIEKSDRRIFKGHITAEIIDRQQEFVFVKEVMAIMKTFMEVNPVISDFHSNRMVGRVLDYEKSEYEGVPTVKITAEVYKKDGVTLYDKIWDKVVSGEYSGLSMGGASREREPIMKDGRMALELRKLELYEIALCVTPANPFAIIEQVNIFAKAFGKEEMVKDDNGRQYIQCTSIGCRFEKGTNLDEDVDIDNHSHSYVCIGKDVCDICGKPKEEHGLEQFDKPAEKGLGDAKALVGRSAETRSESIGESQGSPKEVNDTINAISAGKVKKDYGSQTVVPADMGGSSKGSDTQKDILDKKIKTKEIPIDLTETGMGKSGEKVDTILENYTQPNKVKKDHIPSTPEHIEVAAKRKIAGEQAGSRTIPNATSDSRRIDVAVKSGSTTVQVPATSVDKSHELPKVDGGIVETEGANNYTSKQSAPDLKGSIGDLKREPKPLVEGMHDESRNPAEHQKQSVAEDKPKQWKDNVNSYIKQHGKEAVRKIVEEADTKDYLVSILKKYKSS